MAAPTKKRDQRVFPLSRDVDQSSSSSENDEKEPLEEEVRNLSEKNQYKMWLVDLNPTFEHAVVDSHLFESCLWDNWHSSKMKHNN